MPLQKQNVSVNFARGIDTKTDPKQVIPGKLLQLENGILQTRGKIRKRNGYAAFGTGVEGGGTIASGAGLATFQGQLTQFTGSEAYAYSPATRRWTDKGSAVSLELTTQHVIRNAYQQTSPDCAYHNAGLKLFVWEDSRGGSRYSVIDSSTGQVIVNDVQLSATAVKPKAFAVGNYLVVVYVDTSSNHLKYAPVSVSTPSVLGAATDLATNLHATNQVYDAALLGTSLYVAYNNSDVGGGISVRYLSNTLAISAAVTISSEAASVCMNVAVDAVQNRLWVSYYNGTAVKAFCHDSLIPGSTVLAATVIQTVASVRNVIAVAANGTATFYYELSAAASYNYLIRTNTCTVGGSVGTPSVFLRSVGLASKPFSYGGTTYFTVVFQSTLQPTYFVVSTVGKIVAKLSPGTGGGITAKSVLPEVAPTAAANFLFAFLEKDSLNVVSGAVYTQIGVGGCSLNFASQVAFLHQQMGKNLLLTGGILSMYDGISVIEHGFHLYPENATGTTSTSGGSLAAGTYQYYVTYEWMDAQGQIHKSAPGLVSFSGATNVTTTGSSSSNTLTIPTLRLTAKHSRTPVWIVVYRTDVNGTVFYRATSITSPLLNDPTVDTVTFTDTAATVAGNDLLYTNGSVVENIAAPAASFATKYKNRVVVIPSEDKRSWWFSKEVIPGAPVEFSDLFSKQISSKSGDLVGAIEMDDKLILFTRNEPYGVVGDGPTVTGTNDNFSEAQLITTAQTGCSNPRSLVLMPDGIMRQTDKGIFLLDRSLTDIYVGASVEAYNGDTVTAATLVPNTTQVRFTMASGVALVYDYALKDEMGIGQWAVYTSHAAVDATIFQNQFTYVTSAGVVMQETPGSYTDNGAFIKLKVVTSWLSLAGLQGFQRVYRAMPLGDYASPHELLIQVAYDFNPVFVQQNTIDATSLLASSAYGSSPTYGSDSVYGGAFEDEEFEIHLQQQKCTAVQFSIEDVQSSNFGEGFSLSAIALRVGVKAGLRKRPATRSFG